MKFRFNKILAAMVMMAIFCQSNVAWAAFPEEEVARLKEQLAGQVAALEPGNCYETLVPLYDLEILSFLSFLETNFQNKSSNSSLSDLAIKRYGEFKRAMREHFNSLESKLNFTTVPTTESQLAAYNVCSELTDVYIEAAKKQMIEHIKNTSASKKATVMLEKYQAINDRLKELHLEVAKMYGLLATFKAKLPGFVRQCLTNRTSAKGDLLRQARSSLLTVSGYTPSSVAPSFLASHPFAEVLNNV